VLNLVA